MTARWTLCDTTKLIVERGHDAAVTEAFCTLVRRAGPTGLVNLATDVGLSFLYLGLTAAVHESRGGDPAELYGLIRGMTQHFQIGFAVRDVTLQ